MQSILDMLMLSILLRELSSACIGQRAPFLWPEGRCGRRLQRPWRHTRRPAAALEVGGYGERGGAAVEASAVDLGGFHHAHHIVARFAEGNALDKVRRLPLTRVAAGGDPLRRAGRAGVIGGGRQDIGAAKARH